MDHEYINISPDNIENEHLCCIIRSKKPHAGIEAKKIWLSERLKEGHVFRKLNVKGEVFIEYAPLETAWVPIDGANYMYIYCLWVNGEYKGKGYGKDLLEYCIADAKSRGMSGLCMLGAKKQKHWLTSQSFCDKFGFRVVDSTDTGYELFSLSFDGTVPVFSQTAKKESVDINGLVVYFDCQCPFISQYITTAEQYCNDNNIAASFIKVDSLQKAKQLPCVFNNCAVFYNGVFKTVNLPDTVMIRNFVGNVINK